MSHRQAFFSPDTGNLNPGADAARPGSGIINGKASLEERLCSGLSLFFRILALSKTGFHVKGYIGIAVGFFNRCEQEIKNGMDTENKKVEKPFLTEEQKERGAGIPPFLTPKP